VPSARITRTAHVEIEHTGRIVSLSEPENSGRPLQDARTDLASIVTEMDIPGRVYPSSQPTGAPSSSRLTPKQIRPSPSSRPRTRPRATRAYQSPDPAAVFCGIVRMLRLKCNPRGR
jgi:hypothetical protein